MVMSPSVVSIAGRLPTPALTRLKKNLGRRSGPGPRPASRIAKESGAAGVQRHLLRGERGAHDVDAGRLGLVDRLLDELVGEGLALRLLGQHCLAVLVLGALGQLDGAGPVGVVDQADALAGRPDQLARLVHLPQLVAGAELGALLDDEVTALLRVV